MQTTPDRKSPWHNATQRNTTQHNATQCNTMQHNADTMQHKQNYTTKNIVILHTTKKHKNIRKKIWQTQYILLSLQKRQQYGARYLRKQGGYK